MRPPILAISLAKACRRNCAPASLGIVYAWRSPAFGGTAQFIVTWLINATGSPLAPAWYMSGALVLGLVAMLTDARERADQDARLIALSCQRRSSHHSSSDSAAKISDAGQRQQRQRGEQGGDLQPVAGFHDAPGQARGGAASRRRIPPPPRRSAPGRPPIFMPDSR